MHFSARFHDVTQLEGKQNTPIFQSAILIAASVTEKIQMEKN
jgi:hypothetical protein